MLIFSVFLFSLFQYLIQLGWEILYTIWKTKETNNNKLIGILIKIIWANHSIIINFHLFISVANISMFDSFKCWISSYSSNYWFDCNTFFSLTHSDGILIRKGVWSCRDSNKKCISNETIDRNWRQSIKLQLVESKKRLIWNDKERTKFMSTWKQNKTEIRMYDMAQRKKKMIIIMIRFRKVMSNILCVSFSKDLTMSFLFLRFNVIFVWKTKESIETWY